MRKYILTIVVLLLFWGAIGQLDAADYGPGPHWVDSVATSGTYVFPSALVEFGIDWDSDGTPDMDAQFAGGPATVNHTAALDDSISFPGLRPLDGHLDVVDTEILSATLLGFGGAAGTTLRIGTAANVSSVPSHAESWPSLGAVAELPTDNSLAEGFFEVYFEVDGVFLIDILHNDEPLRLSTVIDRAPPPIGTDYVADQLPLPLYNADHIQVAQLTSLTTGEPGHFMIIPEPSTFVLLSIGAVGLVAYGWRKRRRC